MSITWATVALVSTNLFACSLASCAQLRKQPGLGDHQQYEEGVEDEPVVFQAVDLVPQCKESDEDLQQEEYTEEMRPQLPNKIRLQEGGRRVQLDFDTNVNGIRLEEIALANIHNTKSRIREGPRKVPKIYIPGGPQSSKNIKNICRRPIFDLFRSKYGPKRRRRPKAQHGTASK